MRPLACVILAAGKGTRMKSRLPKPLHQLCGRPMIAHVLDTVAQIGPDRTVVVIGADADQVRPHLPDCAEVVVQDPPRGTGHAAACAQEALADFDGDVLVTCADIPLLRPDTVRSLIELHRSQSATATLLTMLPDDSTGYGRVVRDQTGAVQAIVEHRDADAETLAVREVNTSIYCFDARALSDALARLTPHNDQQEYYLTDVIGLLVADGRPVAAIPVDDPDEVMGINTRVQLAQAERVARDRIRERVMLEGATLLDPASTLIDAGVTVGCDTVIGPGCCLLGGTSVGEGCEIRGQVTLRDATLGDGVLIRDHTLIEQSSIGDECQVGPFTLVRGRSVIGPGCKLGSSAEINRSVLGAGCKMQHFSYLGDAEVGERCNIGAGVVTCNYDGFNKHRTVIEDEAFVGSDAILVAPVRIGSGAYVGAGSVITGDVPAGALGVERGEQRNIEGWVARRRQREHTGEGE